MEIRKQEGMKRGQFLKSLGLSTSALMAFYCLGATMTSCGTKEEDPDPAPGGGTGSGVTGTITGPSINFTIDLANPAYSSLKTVGQYKVIGDVLVAFASGGMYVALSKACTHQGTTLEYRLATNDLFCSNHLSEFSTTGAVEKNPVTGETNAALKVYKTALSANGNTLTVTA
jgi:cytochrome b6-f complex iron-sulfur subunit